MTIIIIFFFSKRLKFDVDSRNREKNQEKLLVLKIISFELGTKNSQNVEHDTCHWQSTCYEKPLTFNISQREIFLKSNSLRDIKNKMKLISRRFY